MKKDCLDIGIIQAFMDGELVQFQMARVSAHIALCDACASMLADAEDESAVVFPALDREFNTLVPTQRLWNKISDSIVVERDNRPFWQKATTFLTVGMMTPLLAAAAALLVVFGVVAAVLINRNPVTNDQAYVPTIRTVAPAQTIPPPTVPNPDTRGGDIVSDTTKVPDVKIERADYNPENRRGVNARAAVTKAPASSNSNGYLPGEESYVKTIASLSRSIDAQKDSVMRPAERFSFERDMAVVDDAIAKMKTEVKRNPKNEPAKQVLYSSYQNKIDLLNSVSQKEELVASLR